MRGLRRLKSLRKGGKPWTKYPPAQGLGGVAHAIYGAVESLYIEMKESIYGDGWSLYIEMGGFYIWRGGESIYREEGRSYMAPISPMGDKVRGNKAKDQT